MISYNGDVYEDFSILRRNRKQYAKFKRDIKCGLEYAGWIDRPSDIKRRFEIKHEC